MTPRHVEEFYIKLEQDGVSLHSRHQVHLALSNAMGRAARQKKIGFNIASPQALSYVPHYKRPEMDVMNDAEIARYIAAAKQYEGTYGALFLVALYTGLRRGELLALKWRDLDWEDKTITVNATLTFTKDGRLGENEPKSKAGRRTVSIGGSDNACVDALKAHRAAQLERRLRCSDWEDHDLVFCSDRGTPVNPSNMYKAFKRFLAQAGLREVKFHSTRHTNITEAMR